MKKFISLNIGTILTFIGIFYLAYYFLLHDHHTSISSIMTHAHQLETTPHLLVLAFLPVYIAVVIFGSALLGVYLGPAIQHLVIRAVRNKTF